MLRLTTWPAWTLRWPLIRPKSKPPGPRRLSGRPPKRNRAGGESGRFEDEADANPAGRSFG